MEFLNSLFNFNSFKYTNWHLIHLLKNLKVYLEKRESVNHFFICQLYEIYTQMKISDDNQGSELLCTLSVKYIPDFKDLIPKKDVKYLLSNFSILITYWNDHILDLLG